MIKTFEVTIPSGETLKGRRYEKKDATQVLCLITGMCEVDTFVLMRRQRLLQPRRTGGLSCRGFLRQRCRL